MRELVLGYPSASGGECECRFPVAVVRTASGARCEPLDVALTESIGQVRDRIADSLGVGSEGIELSYNGACLCVLSAHHTSAHCPWCPTGESLSVEALVSELGVGPGGELELSTNHPTQPPKGRRLISPKNKLEKGQGHSKGKSPQRVVDQLVPDPSVVGTAPSLYTMPSAFTVQVQSSELSHLLP